MSGTVLDARDSVEKQNKIPAIMKNRIFWRRRWPGEGVDIGSEKNHEKKRLRELKRQWECQQTQRALLTGHVLERAVPSLNLHNNHDVFSPFYSADLPPDHTVNQALKLILDQDWTAAKPIVFVPEKVNVVGMGKDTRVLLHLYRCLTTTL